MTSEKKLWEKKYRARADGQICFDEGTILVSLFTDAMDERRINYEQDRHFESLIFQRQPVTENGVEYIDYIVKLFV